MKKTLSILFVILVSCSAHSQKYVTEWLSTGMLEVNQAGFILGKNLEKQDYTDKNLIQDTYFDFNKISPEKGAELNWINQSSAAWKELKADTAGYVQLSKRELADGLALFATYIDATTVQKVKLLVESPQMFEVFLNGKKVISNYSTAAEGETKKSSGKLELDRGKSLILIKSVSPLADSNTWKIRAKLLDEIKHEPTFDITPSERMNIHHILEGQKLSSVRISPDGKYAMVRYSQVNTKTNKSSSWVEIKNIESGKLIQTFRKSKETGISWMPKGHRIYYNTKNEKGYSIWIFDLDRGTETAIMQDVEDAGYINWSPDETYFIFSKSEGEIKNKNGSMIYVDGLSNRYGYSRKNSYLYKYDLQSGVITRLTYGKDGTWLNDISRDGNKILFSQSKPTPTELSLIHI